MEIRLRVCGLSWHKDKILLLRHEGLGRKGYLWSPPGGRAERLSDLSENLKREMLEETHLEVKVTGFKFIHEYIGRGLHAVEHFFDLETIHGEARLGTDPELKEKQLLTGIRYFSWEEIKSKGFEYFHGIFNKIDHLNHLRTLTGYFKTIE